MATAKPTSDSQHIWMWSCDGILAHLHMGPPQTNYKVRFECILGCALRLTP